jgi:hypothetical protein
MLQKTKPQIEILRFFSLKIGFAILVSASQHSTMKGYRVVYLCKSNVSQQLVFRCFLTGTLKGWPGVPFACRLVRANLPSNNRLLRSISTVKYNPGGGNHFERGNPLLRGLPVANRIDFCRIYNDLICPQ